MAVNDRISGLASIASGAYMDIRPAAGVEWSLHNVYHATDAEIYVSDGTNEVLFDSQVGQGAWLKYGFQMANGHYLRVKNTSAGAQIISFDGVETEVNKIFGLSSIAAGSYMDIRPAAGVEWVVHNVYHASDVEIYISDGTNEVLFDYRGGQGAWLKYAFQLANGHYLRVKNTSVSAQIISFDGVQTK